jgi:cell division protein ZapA (FtsZ GTPase activity inhibitor)
MNSTYSEGVKKSVANVVPIEILGVSFTIRTDEDPSYIGGIVADLKARLSSVSGQMKIADPLKLALVTNLLTLDEMRRVDRRSPPAGGEAEAENLLDSLDKRLGELGL